MRCYWRTKMAKSLQPVQRYLNTSDQSNKVLYLARDMTGLFKNKQKTPTGKFMLWQYILNAQHIITGESLFYALCKKKSVRG